MILNPVSGWFFKTLLINWILVMEIRDSSGNLLVDDISFDYFKKNCKGFSFYHQFKPGIYSLSLVICVDNLSKCIEWNIDFMKFEIPGEIKYSKGLTKPDINYLN